MNVLKRVVPPLRAMAQAWQGNYESKGSDASADCVVGFSFGYRSRAKKVTPGLSNQDLADVLEKHFSKLPKILQFEIADAYTQDGNPGGDILRITKHHIPGKYLDTYEVAVQAKDLMQKYGWKTAILLADPYHMPRVQAVCSHLGINWVTDDFERGAVEFDPQSTQKWTRNLGKWRGYEPLALMFYRLKGWL